MKNNHSGYLQLILENTRGSIFCLNDELKITFANSSFLRETGYSTQEEVLNRNIFEMISSSPENGFSLEQEKHSLFISLKNKKKAENERIYFQRKDKTGFFAEYNSFPVNIDSAPCIYVVNFINITERDANSREVARLSGLPEDNPNPIIEICSNSNSILYCNPAASIDFPELNPLTGAGKFLVDWKHPLFSGLESMVYELKLDGLAKALDVLDIEIGDPFSENYRVYNRKLRYIPEDSTIRLYATDITKEQELLEGTKILLEEVDKIKQKLEGEHKEAEEIGKSLLYREPENKRLIATVGVEQSSEAGGDRAGFLVETNQQQKTENEWLAVFDASGHGKGAAKFQEVALGGILTLLLQGHNMKESLISANRLLEKFNSGRFLVGNIWRVMERNEREVEDGFVWLEEFSIGQHPVMVLEPGKDEVRELDFLNEENRKRTAPMGLFSDGFENIAPRYEKLKAGTRTVTYTDGITEAMDKENRQFGKTRLKDHIFATKDLTTAEAYAFIVHAVKCWVNNLPSTTPPDEIGRLDMADDITVAIVDIF